MIVIIVGFLCFYCPSRIMKDLLCNLQNSTLDTFALSPLSVWVSADVINHSTVTIYTARRIICAWQKHRIEQILKLLMLLSSSALPRGLDALILCDPKLQERRGCHSVRGWRLLCFKCLWRDKRSVVLWQAFIPGGGEYQEEPNQTPFVLFMSFTFISGGKRTQAVRLIMIMCVVIIM